MVSLQKSLIDYAVFGVFCADFSVDFSDYLQLKFLSFLVLIRLPKKTFLQMMVNTKFYIQAF